MRDRTKEREPDRNKLGSRALRVGRSAAMASARAVSRSGLCQVAGTTNSATCTYCDARYQRVLVDSAEILVQPRKDLSDHFAALRPHVVRRLKDRVTLLGWRGAEHAKERKLRLIERK